MSKKNKNKETWSDNNTQQKLKDAMEPIHGKNQNQTYNVKKEGLGPNAER